MGIRKLVLRKIDSPLLSSHGFLAALHLDVGPCESSLVRVSMSASVIMLLLLGVHGCNRRLCPLALTVILPLL